MATLCSYDLTHEAQLISGFLDTFWATWPEVIVNQAPWQHESREASPQASIYRDIVYDCFPFLFFPDFPSVPLQKMRVLAQAGRLYALHAFLSDGMLDKHLPPHTTLRCSILQAEALHLLYQLFPAESSFWFAFQQSQHQYLSALREELQWRERPLSDFDLPTAERIASGKAALTSVAIAALASLDRKEEQLAILDASLTLGNIGLQFYDDLRDWKDDFVAGQPSLLLAELCQELGWTSLPTDPDQRVAQISQLKRHLYRSGLARCAAERATEYFVAAQEKLESLPPPVPTPHNLLTWRRLLRDCQRATLELERDIRRLMPSQKPLAGASALPTVLTSGMNAVDAMLGQAVGYLCEQQGSEGEWGDFLFSIGHSTDWISGYVGQALAVQDRGKPCPYHPRLAQTANWLLRTGVDGGWGYNSRAPRDADSTSNIGLFLTSLAQQEANLLPPDYLATIAARLQRYQRTDGGFSTYITEDAEGGYYIVGNNWLDSHVEITATCGRYFLAMTRDISSTMRMALTSLMSKQTPEGTWLAYWYDGPFYGTAQAMKFVTEALHAGWQHATLAGSIRRLLKYMRQTQKETGGWALHPDDPQQETQAVSTALALHILMSSVEACSILRERTRLPSESPEAKEQDELLTGLSECIARGLLWLKESQEPDGSWPSSYILRVPEPQCSQPWLRAFPKASRATLNHVVRDQQRIFTVATIVHMLNALKKQQLLEEFLTTPPLEKLVKAQNDKEGHHS